MTFDKMWWKDPQSIQTYPKSENFTKNILLLSAADNTGHHLRNMIMSYKLSSSCTWWSLNSAEKSLLCWMWCDVNGQGADAEMTGRVGGGGKPAAPPAESGCGPIRAQIAAKPRSAQPIRSQHTRKTIDIIVWHGQCVALSIIVFRLHRWGTDRHHGPGTFTE